MGLVVVTLQDLIFFLFDWKGETRPIS